MFDLHVSVLLRASAKCLEPFEGHRRRSHLFEGFRLRCPRGTLAAFATGRSPRETAMLRPPHSRCKLRRNAPRQADADVMLDPALPKGRQPLRKPIRAGATD
jgi:hypothetical protein